MKLLDIEKLYQPLWTYEMWCGRLHRKLAFCSISWGNKAVVPISRNSATSCEVDEAPLPFSAMPGPKPLPLIGNSLELMKNMENLRLYFQEGFNKFGDIYRVKGAGMDYISTVYATIRSSHMAHLE